MNETYVDIAKLGLAYGQAKAAAEYAEGVYENSYDEGQKMAAAVAITANRRAMAKTAEAFGIISDIMYG